MKSWLFILATVLLAACATPSHREAAGEGLEHAKNSRVDRYHAGFFEPIGMRR
jgi:uncharacterized lipoprotein YmbA